MGSIVAVLNKRGENAVETVVAMLEASTSKDLENYGVASSTAIETAESTETLLLKKITSPVIIGYRFSKTLMRGKPQLLKMTDATLVFDGRIYPEKAKNSDAAIATNKLQLNHRDNASTFIKETEGDYAFAIAEVENLVAGRDSMGVCPLYYGENTRFAALASERKALWKIGVAKSDSFPPGHVAFVGGESFEFTPARTLVHAKPRLIGMQAASEKLRTLLQESVRKRVSDLKECAVAFSGGLDSSIIAFLTRECGVDAHLIHISLENQPETEHAKRVAEELKLAIHSYSYTEKDVQNTVAKVLQQIETADPVQTSIGIPIYWAAEKASGAGFEVMLAGQGADELFAGYRRYVENYLRFGKEKVQEIILYDIAAMYKTNFERDAKICSFHNVALRLPFAAFQIAEFASELPLDLKIEPKSDTARKLVLRRLAQHLGLGKRVVDRPKKALQYATGVNKALEKIARKEGLSLNKYLQQRFRKTFEKMISHE